MGIREALHSGMMGFVWVIGFLLPILGAYTVGLIINGIFRLIFGDDADDEDLRRQDRMLEQKKDEKKEEDNEDGR